MEPLAIADKLKKKFPDDVLDIVEARKQVGVILRRDHIVEICGWLHDDPDLLFDHLLGLCGVDYRPKGRGFEVVYNLYSIHNRHMIRLRADIPEDECWLDSVIPVWRGADWHERECYDLLGIEFRGHPDLRRILLPEDWQGHPLRKDYPLSPTKKTEWQGYEELKELSKALRVHGFQQESSNSKTAQHLVKEAGNGGT
ncbi:MAG: NADH-quinone oxidoreductase subunit C [Desulfobulbaceae bacterium]|nr:MAG: NADH-quinone oxidoreductase subunit C [Desulfobulbaceae bacterium]